MSARPVAVALGFLACLAVAEPDPDTGLELDEGVELVRAFCTACHSAALIAQNRGDERRWLESIRWMQATQGLGPLGEHEGGAAVELKQPQRTQREVSLSSMRRLRA